MNDNKPSWGGAPQSSDTGKPRWGGTPQSSDTGRPAWGGAPQSSDTGRPAWGGAPQSSDTGRPAWGGAPQSSNTGIGSSLPGNEVPEYPEFIIDNISYKMIQVIASHSGEAKIFEIEQGTNRFALKLYRPGIKPNHDVLEKVMNLRGNGMLIDIYAHGTWKDEKTGILHDYEIMEYCSGGSLADMKPTKNEETMKEYAARMAATLDFAHSHGILHRDVKPANFLFTDESHTRFVLTDWGLAKTLDSKGRAITDSGRTKIYAAPEMYTYIEGRPTYVNAKADFFSMGMTLLAIWKGEGLLLADETELVKNKQEETLPYPSKKEMSSHLLSLIKALTRRNPDVRAGFPEVVRWAKGEIIYKDPHEEDSVKDFRIVFSATENLIAHNAAELGKMMWTHRELAKNYLYKGTLKKWLEEAEQPELANVMDDIVETRYPKDKDGGLFAACLELYPETPFIGFNGKPILTQEDLALELWTNAEEYKKKLHNKKEHPLYDYLRSRKLGSLIPEIQKRLRKEGPAAITTVAYMLNPDLPYKFFDPMLSDHRQVDSLQQLREFLVDGSVNSQAGFDQEDFLIWVAHREPELAGKAKLVFDDAAYDFDYKRELILYTIFPDAGFDFRPIGESKRVTPEDLALKIMEKAEERDDQWFMSNVDGYRFMSDGSFTNSPLHAYLTARNKYGNQISWIKYCLDMDSADNRKKPGPYNTNIARFKMAAGLNGSPLPLHVGDKTLKSPDDVASGRLSSLPEADQDLVADWLTLFYQEELNANYKAKSYFARTADYFELLKKHLPGSSYVKRASTRINDNMAASGGNRISRSKLTTMKWLMAILCVIPLTTVIGASLYILITQGAAEMGQVMESVGFWCGIIIGVLAGIAVAGDSGNLIAGGIAFVVCYLVIYAGLKFIAPAVPWIIVAFFLSQLIWLGIKPLCKKPAAGKGSTLRIQGMTVDEARLRTEMAVAFDRKKQLLGDNLAEDCAEKLYRSKQKANKTLSSLLAKNIIWLLIVTVGAGAFCVWIYRQSKKSPETVMAEAHHVNLLEGNFSGNVKGTPMTITFEEKGNGLNGDMTIKYRSGTTRQTMRAVDRSMWPLVMLRTDNPAITLTIDSIYGDADNCTVVATYLNSKGNRQGVEIHKDK